MIYAGLGGFFILGVCLLIVAYGIAYYVPGTKQVPVISSRIVRDTVYFIHGGA